MNNLTSFQKECFCGVIKSDKALKMLLTDKSNEFREIANNIGYPTDSENWELVILNFCLDFSQSFMIWTDLGMPCDHNAIHKSMTQMRQLARGKTNMTEVTKSQNIAFRIAEDFKSICKRINDESINNFKIIVTSI
jgi:hypothetical protein